LQERGLWKDGLKKCCKLCNSKNKESSRFELSRTDCCADRIIELQPDFVGQLSTLQEKIGLTKHLSIFLPKFHCELAFIEMYWGSCKRFTRENCNYSFAGLKQVLPDALNSVPLDSIRRFARKSARYRDIYRSGATGTFADYCNKKFKSHRAIPRADLALIEEEFKRNHPGINTFE
jgi:hypothetical protein